MVKESSKVCVVGWHFFEKFYKKIEKSNADIYVVAHRHNEILDRRKIKHSVIKNVGLEFGAYSWYLENEWDGKSNILFMHDDLTIDNNFDFKDFFNLCEGFDSVTFRNSATTSGGGRCRYLSKKIISLMIKEYGGIAFDENDRGYIWGKRSLYNNFYYGLEDDDEWIHNIGTNFKMTVSHLIKKYNLKKKDIISDKINLYIRGSKKGKFTKMGKRNPYRLSDHSLLGSAGDGFTENNALKMDSVRGRESYYKWYDFYFANIRREDLNILELGDIKDNLKMWKNYFTNSSIFGINGKDVNENYLVDKCKKIKFGVDILIDNGCHQGDRISLFEKAFGEMNPGGIYILENLRNDYENKNSKVIEYFKEKIDVINFNGSSLDKNYEEMVHIGNKKMGFFEKRIASIHFYMGVCIIFKRYCR